MPATLLRPETSTLPLVLPVDPLPLKLSLSVPPPPPLLRRTLTRGTLLSSRPRLLSPLLVSVAEPVSLTFFVFRTNERMKRVSRDLIADDPFFLLQTTFANAELPLLPPTVPPSVSLESALTDATLDSPPEELMELPALLPNLLAVVSYVSSFFWPFSLLLQRWKKIDETDLRFSFRFFLDLLNSCQRLQHLRRRYWCLQPRLQRWLHPLSIWKQLLLLRHQQRRR